jgi:hypothetical protein
MIWRSAAAAATELGLLFMTDEEHAEKVVGKVCARCRCRVKCLDGAKDKQSELEQAQGKIPAAWKEWRGTCAFIGTR